MGENADIFGLLITLEVMSQTNTFQGIFNSQIKYFLSKKYQNFMTQ